MRPLSYLAITAFAALTAVASDINAFLVPKGGFGFKAGQPATITWKPTTEGTVTIKFQVQGSDIRPDTGSVIAANIPNSGSYSFQVPSDLGADVKYTLEIIDDDNPTDYNFSPPFTVDGSTGTATGFTESATATSDVSTSTDAESTTADVTSTLTSSVLTSSVATTSDVSTTSAASTETSDSEASTSSAETSSTDDEEPTSTDDEDSAEETDSAPDPNGAASLKLPGGILSTVLVVMALL